MKYYVEAWNKGNGVAIRAFVGDYFHAMNLFNSVIKTYNRAVLVRSETDEIVMEYNNA